MTRHETHRHRGKVYQRVDKREARKLWREEKVIGLIGCKMVPFGGWSYPCYVTPADYIEKRVGMRQINDECAGEYLYPDLDVVDAAFEVMLDGWNYYNSIWETGYYPHYYVEMEAS